MRRGSPRCSALSRNAWARWTKCSGGGVGARGPHPAMRFGGRSIRRRPPPRRRLKHAHPTIRRGQEMIARRVVIAGAAAALLGGGVPAHGQTQVQADSGAGRPSLFEARDLYWAAGFAAATLAV